MFRAALLIACCWALTTAFPAPQSAVDAFAGEGGTSAAPSLGTFLQTLSTVTDLLNRFTRTFNGPAQLSEFDDVETAQPRVSLTEEKDAAGGSIYKVTIVRPADSGAKFARQMESTTAAPMPSSTTQAPTQAPPQAPTSPPAPAPTASPPPPAPPSTTTQSPSQVALEVERTLQRRIQDIAFQLQQEEARLEAEQDRRELEAELAGRRSAVDFEIQQQEQERRLEVEERRRELELEQASLDRERALLGQLKAAPQKVADMATAGATVAQIIRAFDSREDRSEELLLRALQQANPNLQFVSPSGAAIPIPRKSAPITSTSFTDQRGRPIRVRYDSPEDSLEDRLRYGANPRLVQVSRPGAQPVYRFADSDEILYSALQSAQAAANPAQTSAALVKQPLVVGPAPVLSSVTELESRVNHVHRHEQHYQPQEQPTYNTNHEMFSEEDPESHEDQVETDAFAPLPIMFLLKKNAEQQQQEQRRGENFESLEDINRSGNRLDEENSDDLTEFEREWHYHPQPPQLADDMRVNRIFRTRNVDYHNPEAEAFDVQESRRVQYGSSPQYHPIK